MKGKWIGGKDIYTFKLKKRGPCIEFKLMRPRGVLETGQRKWERAGGKYKQVSYVSCTMHPLFWMLSQILD